jgi:hypothetical protein
VHSCLPAYVRCEESTHRKMHQGESKLELEIERTLHPTPCILLNSTSKSSERALFGLLFIGDADTDI